MKSLLTGILMLLSVMVAQAQQVVHTVQRGETLESIAAKYHVTKEAITKNNPYASDAFYVGLKLYIPTTQSGNVPQNVGQPQSETIQEPTSSGNNDYSQNKQSEYSYSNNVEKTTKTSVFDPQKQEGAMDVQYHGIDNGWGIGISGGANYFFGGGDLFFGKTNDAVKTNTGYELYFGGNYRYHITENFYLEGRIFAGYYHWQIEYKLKGSEEQKADEAFFGLSPRAGLRFGKFAISAGYRWDWIKFKFKKENCLDRFNIGLTFFFD